MPDASIPARALRLMPRRSARSLRPARAALAAGVVGGALFGSALLAQSALAQAVEHPFSFSLLPGQVPPLVLPRFAWGDVDGDGDLDIVAIGLRSVGTAPTPYAAVLRNDGRAPDPLAPGGVTVRLTAVPLPLALAYGDVALGDIDRDGDLDLLVTGSLDAAAPHRPRAVLYRNDGRGGFTDSGVALPQVFGGSARMADFDGDGALDLLLTGTSTTGAPYLPTTALLRQSGPFAFTPVAGSGLPGLAFGDVRIVDADGDGDLDAFVSGIASVGAAPGAPLGALYLNTGGRFAASPLAVPGGALARIDAVRRGGALDLAATAGRPYPMGLTGSVRVSVGTNAAGTGGVALAPDPLVGGTVLWTDIESDGLPELVIGGQTRPLGTMATRLYRVRPVGTGGSVRLDLAGHLEGLRHGGAAIGDLDGDGDLDIAASGITRTGTAAGVVYRNDNWGRPTVPTPPIAFAATPDGGGLRLRWDAAEGAASYAVRIGTEAGRSDLVAADAAPSGWRTVAQPGPVAEPSLWLSPALLARAPGGRVHIGVQAISAALVGSPFAEIAADVSTVTSAAAPDRPTVWAIGAPAPQPLRGAGHVRVSVPTATPGATLDLVDALGRTVARLHAGPLAPGVHDVPLDGGSLAPGVYMLRLATPGGLVTRPLVIAR